MKKIKISLAALTLIMAIAGTTTANANKNKKAVGLCSEVDPKGTECTNLTDIECCEDDITHKIINAKPPF
jgi:hypothetical protein